MNIKSSAYDLYRQTFGEDKAFDTLLFDNFFENCRYIVENEQVVSMLFELPVTLIKEGERLPLCYVYAAATHPDYRGRGLASRLVEEACARHPRVILRPAEEGLQAFYGRLGFKGCTAHSTGDGQPCISGNEVISRMAAPIEKESFCLMFKGEGFDLPEGTVFPHSMP